MTDVHDWHETSRLHAEQGQGDPFAAAVRATRMPMIVTDPRQRDNPIVYANASFLRMTGYDADEVLGHNCRFLQGPETDKSSIALLRRAVKANQDLAIDLLNYRKDGSKFWNALYMSPVMAADGEVQFFFASQLDITDRIEAQNILARQQEYLEAEVKRRTKALEDALAAKTMLLHEVDHRVKNNLQMVASILGMQKRTIGELSAQTALEGALSRVEAIGTVHRRLYQSKDVGIFDLAEFVGDLAREILTATGRTDVRLAFEMQTVMVPAQQASPIALLFNEVLTNALKHAFPDGRQGSIALTMCREDDLVTIVLKDDGIGLGASRAPGSGFGSRLIRTLVRQLQGTVEWHDAKPGTQVDIAFPAWRTGGSTADA